jgi:prefoldin subunit 5
VLAGKLVHTNEVHMHLGADVMIDTSSKHAQSVLQRRAEFTMQQMHALGKNISALKARPDLASDSGADNEVLDPAICVMQIVISILQHICGVFI